VAVADSVMASAAYYLASQARAVYSAPGALIGSVGTILVHETEPLKLKEELGIETTVITAGKYKAETEPSTSLTAEGQQHLQELIDGFYRDFIKAVAVGRGQPESVVTGPRFGQGRVFKDTEAVARGLADGVKTLERTIADMRGSKQPAAPAPPGDGTWQARMRRAQARARAVEVATRASEITDSPPRVARERRAIGL
jgi:ClpP class serine protease